MTDYPERPECDFTTPYVGEVTRVWPKERELAETKQEARRQLMEMLEPMSAMQRQTARKLLWIISR